MPSVIRRSLAVCFLFSLLFQLALLAPVVRGAGEAEPRQKATRAREAQWKQVEDAVKNGLPKTAGEQLDPIITAALADKSYPEAIKAIIRKITLEGGIQGRKPEEKIILLQAELEKAPAAMKPVMEAILADWYWQYYQQNRWQFLQRTQTAGAAGPDFRTWDLARILAEIDRHFSAALADTTLLQATPIGDYDELLTKGSVPDNYRPTMFDFLAHEALQFYQAGELAGNKAEDEFEIADTDPIFSDASEFFKLASQNHGHILTETESGGTLPDPAEVPSIRRRPVCLLRRRSCPS